MYNSLNSSKLSNLVQEVEAQCSGVAHEQQEETPHDLKGGGHDPQNEEVEETCIENSCTRNIIDS